MPSTLRGEVEALRIANQGSWLGEHLRQILDRHADEVSVPRELFEAMRDDQTKYLGLKRLRGLSDGSDALMSRIAQADAILSDKGSANVS
jgi:hypothetical protein